MADRGLQARARRALAALTASGGALPATLGRGITSRSATVGRRRGDQDEQKYEQGRGEVIISRERDLFCMDYYEYEPMPSRLVGKPGYPKCREGTLKYRVSRAVAPLYLARIVSVHRYGRKRGVWREETMSVGDLCVACHEEGAVSKAGWCTFATRPESRKFDHRRYGWLRCGACGYAQRFGRWPGPAARRAAAAAVLGRRGESAAAYAAGTPPTRPAF